MTTDFDVYVGHGPCMDGHTALSIAWDRQPQAVKDYLAQFGGAYSETPKPFIRGAPHPNSPTGALKIMQEWKLEGYKPVVFCTAEPDCLLPEDLIKDKRVFMTDRDPGAAGLQQLAKHAAYTMILDHHGTFAHSREIFMKSPEYKAPEFACSCDIGHLTPNIDYVWKPEKTNSGTSLTWQYFHPGSPIPPFVESVQIQDTHNFTQNPALHAKETYEAFMSRRVFTSYPRTAKYLTDFPLEELIKEGAPALKLKDGLAGALAAQASIGYLKSRSESNEMKVYTVLYANTPIMTNETLIIMRERHDERRKKDSSLPEVDFCCGWYYEVKESIVKVGLRCPRDGLRLGYIARGIPGVIKGGGHDESAAFRFAGIENLHKFLLPTKPLPRDISGSWRSPSMGSIKAIEAQPTSGKESLTDTLPIPEPKQD